MTGSILSYAQNRPGYRANFRKGIRQKHRNLRVVKIAMKAQFQVLKIATAISFIALELLIGQIVLTE